MKIKTSPLQAACLLGCRHQFFLDRFLKVWAKINLFGRGCEILATLFRLKSFFVFRSIFKRIQASAKILTNSFALKKFFRFSEGQKNENYTSS